MVFLELGFSEVVWFVLGESLPRGGGELEVEGLLDMVAMERIGDSEGTGEGEGVGGM